MFLRIKTVLACVVLAILFLVYKLFDLQIIDGSHMTRMATLQRFQGIQLTENRGTIFDRNLIPFTDNGEESYIVILPPLINNKEYTAQVISGRMGIDYQSILSKLNYGKAFKLLDNENRGEGLAEVINEGLLNIKSAKRYDENSLARHVLGYVDAYNSGLYGIENGYNNLLKRNSYEYVGLITNSFKMPLLGFGYRTIKTYQDKQNYNLVLTLDYHYQKIIEESLDKYDYNGAAVLLDTNSGDILAMVSRPNFEQNNISKYFNSENNELVNKTVYPYNLGSIFKIVVAYAALENEMVSEGDVFFCPGFINVDGQTKMCSGIGDGGHGYINFSEALENSCNTVFIELGLRVGYSKIIDTARDFGLGTYIGLAKYGIDEKMGKVEPKRYFSNREIANISIGQGELLVTPLQVAKMMNIIASGGVEKDINLVDKIIDDEGNIMQKIRIDKSIQKFDKQIISRIQKMMEQVLESGTGKHANVYDFGMGGGKTSSAETGIFKGDEQIIHSWFGGYFPKVNPKYSLVILIEDGKSGAKVAAPLFGEIAEKIVKGEKRHAQF